MSSVQNADMKLEVVGIPVSDVERAAQFYRKLGWRQDADIGQGDGRQASPVHAARLSVLGPHRQGRRPGAPGNDPVRPPRRLRHRGGARGSRFARESTPARSSTTPPAATTASTRMRGRAAPYPQRRSYASFLLFNDPDGNGWLLQEMHHEVSRSRRFEHDIVRLRGRPGERDRQAAAAHGEHEKRAGGPDPNWPDWYAAYMVAEQNGKGLPEYGRRGAGPGVSAAQPIP